MLTGAVTHVRDGDTIVVAGHPIRLEALDCPELNHKGGNKAKVLMQHLTLHATATCDLSGARSYDRVVGFCSVGGKDLGQQMLDAHVCTIYWHFNTRGKYR
jgi:endonuclease YncB( thermonuclease family)